MSKFYQFLKETVTGDVAYIPFHYGGDESEIDTDNHDNVLGVHDKKHIINDKSIIRKKKKG